MKFIAVLFLTFFVYFSFVLPAGATIDPCPSGSGFSGLCGIDANDINKAVQSTITILLIVAMVLSVIFLIWGGVKWITAGGDKGAIEGARTTIIAAIVGLVIAFAGFFIFNLILYFFGIGSGPLTLPRLV